MYAFLSFLFESLKATGFCEKSVCETRPVRKQIVDRDRTVRCRSPGRCIPTIHGQIAETQNKPGNGVAEIATLVIGFDIE